MSVKASFPTHSTTTPSKHQTKHKHTKTCLLQLNRSVKEYSSISTGFQPANIFRQHIQTLDFDRKVERPVGGLQLLKRVENSYENRVRRISKSMIKRSDSVNLLLKKPKIYRTKTEFQEAQQKERKLRIQSSIDPYEQTLKEHKVYGLHNLKHSRISIAPTKGRWKATEQQRKDYLDKSALLGEIAFNRPLKEKVGGQHFQYLMRDRWKDDLKHEQYVYQLKKGQPFSSNKAVLMLKKQHPNIKERKGLLLKGRLLSTIQ